MNKSVSPVGETAYYCCGVRMIDADKKNSLLKDIYARRFMDSHGLQIFNGFKQMARTNMCSIVRAKIVEDHIKEILAEDKNTQFVLLGAGFDSKAFRISGGHWVEIDEHAIIGAKDCHLPKDSCLNPLVRIPVDFSKEELPWAFDQIDKNKKTVFIIEGVFMYLGDKEIELTLSLIRSRFTRHNLIADLMDARFIKDNMGYFLKEIGNFGCSFKFYHDEPQILFERQGYRSLKRTSVLLKAAELKQFFAPKILLKTFYPHLLQGYTVGWLQL